MSFYAIMCHSNIDFSMKKKSKSMPKLSEMPLAKWWVTHSVAKAGVEFLYPQQLSNLFLFRLFLMICKNFILIPIKHPCNILFSFTLGQFLSVSVSFRPLGYQTFVFLWMSFKRFSSTYFPSNIHNKTFLIYHRHFMGFTKFFMTLKSLPITFSM